MEAIENLLTRRSIKKYNDKPIPEEILDKILEVGLYAPTAMGMQKPIILVIKDKKVIQKCELCLENNSEPACVKGCPNKAIIFEEREEE